MVSINQVAEIGLLVGEPTRAAMLIALMNGQALTATELANCANITPQTASSHLARLTSAELLKVVKQGRHRYHRLASPEIAHLIESIMHIAASNGSVSHKITTGPRNMAMRAARTCYNHMAGRLGVAITDSLISQGVIEFDDEAGLISDNGIDFFSDNGIDLNLNPVASANKRTSASICRPCLDWSERRPHVAGKIGTLLCDFFLEKKLVLRIKDTRALEITPKGHKALFKIFGIRNF